MLTNSAPRHPLCFPALAAQKNAQSAASLQPQAAPGEAEMQMQMQLIQQQKELELIKQGKAPAALVAAQ